MFQTIITSGSLTFTDALICTAVSLFCGSAVAFTCSFGKKKSRESANLFLSLAVLPAIVQSVIMMVNGNLGAGVAAAGAFSLVRFRSAPGTSKQISAIFLAMAAGLACGMGYVTFAVFITVVICAFIKIVSLVTAGRAEASQRRLKITIPENLDYTGAFDDLFEKYTVSHELERVKTVNMGTLFELTYTIGMKQDASEKEFIDQIRCRNGNLTVMCGNCETNTASEEL